MRWIALAVATLALASTATAAPVQRTSLNAVESEVMCVSCGVPLAIADSPQADAERREIVEQVKAGKTKQEILDNLVDTYGDRVLASPKAKGFGLAAYLVPIVIVALAILAGILVVPKWRRTRGDGDGADDASAQGPALSDADSQRLAEDLARYEV